MKPDTDLLTTSSAARVLGLSEAGVRALERRGELPAVRTEKGMRLFQRDTVQRVAEERARDRERAP